MVLLSLTSLVILTILWFNCQNCNLWVRSEYAIRPSGIVCDIPLGIGCNENIEAPKGSRHSFIPSLPNTIRMMEARQQQYGNI